MACECIWVMARRKTGTASHGSRRGTSGARHPLMSAALCALPRRGLSRPNRSPWPSRGTGVEPVEPDGGGSETEHFGGERHWAGAPFSGGGEPLHEPEGGVGDLSPSVVDGERVASTGHL